MAHTLLSLLESVSNPAGRFRTLKDISPAMDSAGKPLFTVRGEAVHFTIATRKGLISLRCPLNDESAYRTDFSRTAFDYTNKRSPYLLRSDFLREELLVFDTRGNSSRIDVTVEYLPEVAMELPRFVRSHLYSRDRTPLRRLLSGLHSMAGDFADKSIIHGHLRAEKILVLPDGIPAATDWIAVPKRDDHDDASLARMAAVIYIASSEPDAYRLAGERELFRASVFGKYLPNMITQAEFSGNDPLLSTLHHACGKGRGGDLSAVPFERMLLLIGLLDGQSDTEVEFRPRVRIVNETVSGNTTGIISFGECEIVGPLSDNLARFCLRGGWGFADTDGNIVTGTGAFISAGDFYEGRAVAQTAQGQGLLDRDGNFILEPEFELLEWYGPYNVAAGCRDGKWELYDRLGQQLTTGNYDWIGDCGESIFPVRRGSKFGYIRTDGTHITDVKYDEAYGFSGGNALVSKSGEHFHIDSNGLRK